MTKTTTPAKPVCTIPKADSTPCTTPPTWRLRRVDGSTFTCCTRHWHELETQMNRRPEAFSSLEVDLL